MVIGLRKGHFQRGLKDRGKMTLSRFNNYGYWLLMKDITVLLYWTNMREITSYWFDVLREITSYWFDVQKRTNFKQLFCATCRFPHSYLTYVQFAVGIMSYFLFHGIKLLHSKRLLNYLASQSFNYARTWLRLVGNKLDDLRFIIIIE